MNSKSVMDGATYHHSMRGAMSEGKKVAGVTGQYEEQESDGKRKKRKKAPAGERRIVVGMKLASACREVLTWTIAKVALPGDLVIALHVAPFPPLSGFRGEDACADQQQLASSLHTVLSVYEGLCNLKQIKLQLEIVNGTKARNTLVNEARNYDAYKLILGTTRNHAAGWSASLGKYCIKRLPSTCSVVIVDQWKIMFDRKGAQIETPGTSMMKILRRSVKSIGRSRKVSGATSCIDDDGTASTVSTPTTTTEAKDTTIREYDDRVSVNDFDSASSSSSTILRDDSVASRSKSDLGSPISVLPCNRIESALSDFEAFRFSFSKRRLECSVSKRSSSLRDEKQNLRRLCGEESDGDEDDSGEELDPYPTEACNSDDNESRFPVPVCNENLVSETIMSLKTEETIHKDRRVVPSSLSGAISKAAFSLDSEETIQKGWPLMHRSLSLDTFNLPLGKTLDRSMSVVNWALQLPKRNGEFTERMCISQDLRKGGNRSNRLQSCGEEFGRAQVRLSFSLPHVRARTLGRFEPERLMSLTGQIHQVCRDRPRVYTYEELDNATSGFSPSNLIGIGGGSQVYRGETRDGCRVAVKLLNQDEYLAQRNQQMIELKERRKSAKGKERAAPDSPTSFDAFVDSEGKLKTPDAENEKELPSPPSAEPVSEHVQAEMREVEKQLEMPLSAAQAVSASNGWSFGSLLANPFSDEHALDRSETPKPPVPPKEPLETEGESRTRTTMDSYFEERQPQPESLAMPGSFTPRQPEPSQMDQDYEDLSFEEQEQIAIAISLSEAEAVAEAERRASQQNEMSEEDADLKAAIAASLQEVVQEIGEHVPPAEMLQPLVDLTPPPNQAPPLHHPAPRGHWETFFDQDYSPAQEPLSMAQLSTQTTEEDEDELYRVTPNLTRARLATHNAEQAVVPPPPSSTDTISLPYDPVREAAASQTQQDAMEASFYSAISSAHSPASTHTMDHEPAAQLVDVSEDVPQPAHSPISAESFGFQTDSEPDSETFASVSPAPSVPPSVAPSFPPSATTSRAQSRARSEISNIEVVDLVEDSDVDMLSEEGDGIATPDSWTEVGSEAEDEDMEHVEPRPMAS